MTKKKIYRTVIEVEVLSETPYIDGLSLEEIAYDIEDGACSGLLKTITKDQVLEGEEAVEAIKNHVTDTEFFGMDTEGNDLDELF